MDIEAAAKQLDALGSPTRMMMFRALVRAGADGLSVRRLQEKVGVTSASTLSHHMQRLIAAGLVAQERQATTLICRADPSAARRLATFLFEDPMAED
jgi:ArsR family transcriptional regulator, arsenate/arsenite/antimonite-responsive transcriptional repressor